LLANQRSNAAQATTSIQFQGNLSSDGSTHVVDSVNVFDSAGGQHTLKLSFANDAPANAGTWTVTVTDGATTVGTGDIKFVNGAPDPSASTLALTYSPSGVTPLALTFDFSTNVTSFAAGTTSTLAFDKQNGFGAGSLTNAKFDAQGRLTLTYSNGQTSHGAQLAVARFDTTSSLEPLGGNKFASRDDGAMHVAGAGSTGFATVSSGVLELSNVDLSQEFGDLIVTQRGYQASSQIISTANDMIQQLFDMKSRR
jgi:flagellar hook protein FlgE